MKESKNISVKYLLLRIIVIAIFIGAGIIYGLFCNQSIDNMQKEAPELLLQEFPEIQVDEIILKQKLSTKDIFNKGSKLVVAHMWATWCAPCETELFELFEFTKKFKNPKEIVFVFIAVKDQIKLVENFLKKRKVIFSKNMLITVDVKGESLNKFGSFKVPETFVFSNDGKIVTKYMGPQNWTDKLYYDQLTELLK